MVDNEKKVSQKVAEFSQFLVDASKNYGYCKDQLEELNKKQEDLLHAIELNDEGYKARNRLAAQLETCRRARRWYKDRCEELSPLVSFCCDPKYKPALEQLKQVLGQIRKVEDRRDYRKYCPRSLSPEMEEFFCGK